MDLSRASQWFPRSFADRHPGAAPLRLGARTSDHQGPCPLPQSPQSLCIPLRPAEEIGTFPASSPGGSHRPAAPSPTHGRWLILNCAGTGVGAAWGAIWQANTASASLSNTRHVTAEIPAPCIGVRGVLYC